MCVCVNDRNLFGSLMVKTCSHSWLISGIKMYTVVYLQVMECTLLSIDRYRNVHCFLSSGSRMYTVVYLQVSEFTLSSTGIGMYTVVYRKGKRNVHCCLSTSMEMCIVACLVTLECTLLPI